MTTIAEKVLAEMRSGEEEATAAEKRAGVAPGRDGYTGGGWAPRYYPDGSYIDCTPLDEDREYYSDEDWALIVGGAVARRNDIGLAAYRD